MIFYRWLTGIPIISIETAMEAISQLHEKGVPHIVLTSFEREPHNNLLSLIGSQKKPEWTICHQFEIQFPRLSGYFTGAGDLLSALILARFHLCDDDLQLACEQALGTIQAVIRRTFQQREHELASLSEIPRTEQLYKSRYMRATELRILDSKTDIEWPAVNYRAKPLLSSTSSRNNRS